MGLVEVLHFPKLVVPSGEVGRKVVQRHRPIRVSLWVKIECFPVEDSGFVEVPHCPELLVPIVEVNREVA